MESKNELLLRKKADSIENRSSCTRQTTRSNRSNHRRKKETRDAKKRINFEINVGVSIAGADSNLTQDASSPSATSNEQEKALELLRTLLSMKSNPSRLQEVNINRQDYNEHDNVEYVSDSSYHNTQICDPNDQYCDDHDERYVDDGNGNYHDGPITFSPTPSYYSNADVSQNEEYHMKFENEDNVGDSVDEERDAPITTVAFNNIKMQKNKQKYSEITKDKIGTERDDILFHNGRKKKHQRKNLFKNLLSRMANKKKSKKTNEDFVKSQIPFSTIQGTSERINEKNKNDTSVKKQVRNFKQQRRPSDKTKEDPTIVKQLLQRVNNEDVKADNDNKSCSETSNKNIDIRRFKHKKPPEKKETSQATNNIQSDHDECTSYETGSEKTDVKTIAEKVDKIKDIINRLKELDKNITEKEYDNDWHALFQNEFTEEESTTIASGIVVGNSESMFLAHSKESGLSGISKDTFASKESFSIMSQVSNGSQMSSDNHSHKEQHVIFNCMDKLCTTRR